MKNARALLDEAKTLFTQADGIRNRYANASEMPAEDLKQVNDLLDQVDSLKEQANQAERIEKMGNSFSSPREEMSVPTNSEAKFSGEVSAEVKSLASAVGLDVSKIAPTPVDLNRAGQYDPNRAVKHAVAVSIYWKYGKDFDRAIANLPKAFAKFAPELKDLATQPGAAGGFLVADTQLSTLIELQKSISAMRQISNVLPPIPGGSVIAPSEDSELSDPVWTSEVGTGSDDTVEPFGERMLTPKALAKRIKISRTLLRGATLANVESWVLDRLSRKFDVAEEAGFISGNGVQKPTGLLTAAITAMTTAAANTVTSDDIINWAYALPAAYSSRAVILCNRSFIRKVRLLREGSGTGQYLWQPGLAQGSPSTILDWPYYVSDQYPTGLTNDAFDNNALVATIGDFAYYWIVDALNFEVQRLDELYAATNQVGFIGRKETDGMVVAVDAFRNLKVKST